MEEWSEREEEINKLTVLMSLNSPPLVETLLLLTFEDVIVAAI